MDGSYDGVFSSFTDCCLNQGWARSPKETEESKKDWKSIKLG